MHLLYLDDSGSTANVNERFLVLGGVSIFEAQAEHLTRELDKFAETIVPGDPHSVEFHASEIFSGRTEPWKSMSKEERRGVIKQVLRIFCESYESGRAFACAIHKSSYAGRDPMEMAFEDLCSRFDRYLNRLRAKGDRQRGLIILDDSSYETALRDLAREFRTVGTRWGGIHNLADTPMFLDSKASRLVQIADHVAYAVFRRYEAKDVNYFDIIAPRFDEADGVLHGLSHKDPSDPSCMCPACITRRS